jgi:predicted ABC-type ATPase
MGPVWQEAASMPSLYMVAGPNGAGKTTTAMQLLPNYLDVFEFLNADSIAYGLNPLDPRGQAIAAGKLMLKRVDELIARGRSFAFESTGSAKSYAARMRYARAQGYQLGLIYLWLPSPFLAQQRVASRVKQGGHDIPVEDIHRRYTRSLRNLREIYLDLVDVAGIFDATALPAKLIVEKRQGELNWAGSDCSFLERILQDG